MMNRIKKHRGIKRYYKSLSIGNDIDKINWLDTRNAESWKNWHMQFDWYGYGNNSFKRRKPHLDKLFRHFDLLVKKTSDLSLDFQLYAVLLDFDSASDALFLHTPNPNNSQFPFKVSDLQSTTTLTNRQLDNYINSLEGYEKLYGQTGYAFCLIFKNG